MGTREPVFVSCIFFGRFVPKNRRLKKRVWAVDEVDFGRWLKKIDITMTRLGKKFLPVHLFFKRPVCEVRFWSRWGDSEDKEHLKQAQTKKGDDSERFERTQFALESIGGAVLGSAMTTVGSSFFLLFCTLTVFILLGPKTFSVFSGTKNQDGKQRKTFRKCREIKQRKCRKKTFLVGVSAASAFSRILLRCSSFFSHGKWSNMIFGQVRSSPN